MKLSELEEYRDSNGFINIDTIEKSYDIKKMPENRGSSNKETDWFIIEDGDVLARTGGLSQDAPYTVYAELIYEELCKQVGIECAHYDLAIYKGQRGVLSQNVAKDNESLILMKDIMDSVGVENYENEPICIDAILETVHSMCKFEDISNEQRSDICKDICKVAIFDVFTMSTDRHSRNLAILYSEGDIKMSPLFDNECSLMLDITPEEMLEFCQDPKRLKEYASLQMPIIYAPSDDTIHYHNDWENTLDYICDSSDELYDEAQNYYNKMDINKAMIDVEERIKCKLPQTLKEFLPKVFEQRNKMIGNHLLLDIEMDDKEEEKNNEDGYMLE